MGWGALVKVVKVARGVLLSVLLLSMYVGDEENGQCPGRATA